MLSNPPLIFAFQDEAEPNWHSEDRKKLLGFHAMLDMRAVQTDEPRDRTAALVHLHARSDEALSEFETRRSSRRKDAVRSSCKGFPVQADAL